MSAEKSYARLSTSKNIAQPILCGQCNYEFGLVWDESRSEGIGPGKIPDAELEPRTIFLWGGWQRQPVNGVVSLTKYALKRFREGKVPRYRRGLDEGGEHLAFSPEYDLPATLRCPQCRELQILDKDRLNADRVYEGDGLTRVIKMLPRASVGRHRS